MYRFDSKMATIVPNNEIRMQDYLRRQFIHNAAKKQGLNVKFPMPIMKMPKSS